MGTESQLHSENKASGPNSSTNPQDDEVDHMSENLVCSICEFGGAESFLLLCDGKGCSSSIGTLFTPSSIEGPKWRFALIATNYRQKF